ncbi:hypothetical protein WA026_006018 [Henosepilachna vigintioctopunctata]|uniref:ABC transporter domain-containing protein n=1 Tax=Henosepilachna vigintioctopunctata TaxID=420089 RepID=A0AAW1TJD8_9CUCU
MEVVIHEAASGVVDSESGLEQSQVNYQVKNGDVRFSENGVNNAKFNRLPTKSPIDISFQNIVYNAPLGFRKGSKKILHSINGRFPPGQLIAIMGPSGAGKSTLLDILSGYRRTDIEGSVLINGENRDLKTFRKMTCYITQEDRLQPLLTVKENMMIAADLKLPTDTTMREKLRIIHEILVTLSLVKAEQTLTGQLSGGQRKRLSIALELISNPLVLFLDEPTTGLDSSSCSQCINLLQTLARQGRTIVCTIHQPSASMFQVFDQVYVLSEGKCLYQGSATNMVQFFNEIGASCPMYHNPADYVIEIACGEYGSQIIDKMVHLSDNGRSLHYFNNPHSLPDVRSLKEKADHEYQHEGQEELEATSQWNQLKVLMRRGWIKMKRDETLTYMRIIVNIAVGIMLGTLYWQIGNNASRTLDNYNLLFSILMHCMMSPMMLTILTFPGEMSILIKEHFNRWYTLKMYFLSVTIMDIPLSILCGTIFGVIIYYMTGQPLVFERFLMFLAISLLVTFVAQSFGLMIGSIFDVVNGNFVGPTTAVPIMMFAGFGVRINDLPGWLYWGSYVSYLRYGLEGLVGAIYGMKRGKLECPEEADYCLHAAPSRFLEEIGVRGDQFWNDIVALLIFIGVLKLLAYFLLRLKLMMIR